VYYFLLPQRPNTTHHNTTTSLILILSPSLLSYRPNFSPSLLLSSELSHHHQPKSGNLSDKPSYCGWTKLAFTLWQDAIVPNQTFGQAEG
jgi:hypothetical protein